MATTISCVTATRVCRSSRPVAYFEDYTEQSSWLLFLKYLDALEADKTTEAELEGKAYSFILDKTYCWETWAAPKTADGKLDHNTALTGDDLTDFVNRKLFPYLAGFKQRATGPNTIEYKIGEIFGEIKNRIQSGYNLRDVIERVTANDGKLGDQHLRDFQDNEKTIPTILTTSQKLSTGVDARNVRNIVLLRPVNSMIEFKQIIGRGTRLYDGKDYFTIYDFVRAHHHFNDPE